MNDSTQSSYGQTERLWSADLDALIAAPDNHILLLENDRVRVLNTTVAPGDRTPIHTHRWPAVLHILSWSHFVRYDDSGNVLLDTRTLASLPSEFMWSAPLPPHSLENVGDTTLHIIAVELKDRAV